MGASKTFQGRVADITDETFVGRREQLSLFETLLRPDARFVILGISGQPGVGKTTLLRRFRHRATELGAIWALSNDQREGAIATLAEFARDCAAQGAGLDRFSAQYDKYLRASAGPKQTGTPDDRMGPAEALRTLTEHFIQDLNSITRPLVLMLDVYDATSDPFDRWLRIRSCKKMKNGPSSVGPPLP